MKEEKNYFIMNDTQTLSFGEFSSDTTEGRLKVMNVNDNE